MILTFRLIMLNVKTCNGRRSDEGRDHVRVVTFRGKSGKAKGQQILSHGSYRYNFGDGWWARIDVEQVSSSTAAKIRRSEPSFCGYNWMVDSIFQFGKILSTHQQNEQMAQ
jgi:hypothetical protein